MIRRLLVAAAIAAATSGVAACGGDDDAGSGSSAASTTSTTAAKRPTGAPLKLMTVAAIGTPGADNPQVAASAKAAAEAINAQGGVKGRPIEIISCNDKGDPNGTNACAREAVADKVIAVIPNNTNGASLFPTLDQAKIPAIATNPVTPPDVTADMSFPITAGAQVRNLSSATAVKQNGGKSIVGMTSDLSAAKEQLGYMKRGAELAGIEYKRDIIVPLEATDYAPYVQQLKDSGADAAVLGLSVTQVIPVAQAAVQQGMKVTFVHGSTTIEQDVVKQLQDVGAAGNFLILSYLPPPNADVMQPYRDELDAAADRGDKDVGEDVRGLDSQLAWLGVHAFASAAEKVSGEITSASLTQVLEGTESIPLLGGAVTWKLGEAGAPPKSAPRLTDGSMYVNKVGGDGQLQLTSPDPIDGLALLEQSGG